MLGHCAPRTIAPRRAAARRSADERLGSGASSCRLRASAADVQEVTAVAADDDLVAVAQRLPLDALAVDEHAVEAAVVEHAHAVGWRTTSAWRRETVGSSKRTSAARRRPIRVHSRVSAARRDLAVLLVGEVLARARRAGRARARDQAGRRPRPRRRRAGEARRGEQRGAHERLAAAAGAGRKRVAPPRASRRSRSCAQRKEPVPARVPAWNDSMCSLRGSAAGAMAAQRCNESYPGRALKPADGREPVRLGRVQDPAPRGESPAMPLVRRPPIRPRARRLLPAPASRRAGRRRERAARDCGRTPLVGRDACTSTTTAAMVCELCRPQRARGADAAPSACTAAEREPRRCGAAARAA